MSISMPDLGRTRRWKTLAAMTLFLAWVVPVQSPGFNQTAHYALVRALAERTPTIDTSISEMRLRTGDVSFFHGHRYAAKAPGLAFWTLPAFLMLKAVGGAKPSGDLFRILWFLGLWGVVLPAIVLFLLVRKVADRVAPGYGTITATTLGIATLMLPFATLFFAHVLTATLGFAAFVLLWQNAHTRVGAWRPLLAGVLAGFAIATEFPSVILVAALAGYLVARERRVTPALGYGAGVLIGVAPLLLFNQWAFGSITHLSYAGAETNRVGLFGVTRPNFQVASELLFWRIGLLRVAPVLILAVLGIVLMHRRGHRAEAILIAGISLAYLVFNSGYTTPFGGLSPGPRFLVPIIPFLVVAIAPVFERLPFTAIALAGVSAIQMIVMTMTDPQFAAVENWFSRLRAQDIARTALFFGPKSPRFIPLFALLMLLVSIFAILATPRLRLSRVDICRGALALAGWLLIAYKSPAMTDHGGALLAALYAAIAAAGLIAFALPRMVFHERHVVAEHRSTSTSS
jgi:hypothetical protein